jgi:hypothetical protein
MICNINHKDLTSHYQIWISKCKCLDRLSNRLDKEVNAIMTHLALISTLNSLFYEFQVNIHKMYMYSVVGNVWILIRVIITAYIYNAKHILPIIRVRDCGRGGLRRFHSLSWNTPPPLFPIPGKPKPQGAPHAIYNGPHLNPHTFRHKL